jgi:hypothetical protein
MRKGRKRGKVTRKMAEMERADLPRVVENECGGEIAINSDPRLREARPRGQVSLRLAGKELASLFDLELCQGLGVVSILPRV